MVLINLIKCIRISAATFENAFWLFESTLMTLRTKSSHRFLAIAFPVTVNTFHHVRKQYDRGGIGGIKLLKTDLLFPGDRLNFFVASLLMLNFWCLAGQIYNIGAKPCCGSPSFFLKF